MGGSGQPLSLSASAALTLGRRLPSARTGEVRNLPLSTGLTFDGSGCVQDSVRRKRQIEREAKDRELCAPTTRPSERERERVGQRVRAEKAKPHSAWSRRSCKNCLGVLTRDTRRAAESGGARRSTRSTTSSATPSTLSWRSWWTPKVDAARGEYMPYSSTVTQRALSVTQRALSVTQRALSVTQRALSVTQRALSVTQRALSVTQQDVSVTQRALSVTQQDVSVVQEAHLAGAAASGFTPAASRAA
jgi:hypothetical protein